MNATLLRAVACGKQKPGHSYAARHNDLAWRLNWRLNPIKYMAI